MFRRISPVILVLLIFAGIGFVFQLINDPVGIIVMVGLSALIIFMVRNYMKTGKFLPRFSKATTAKPKTMTSRPQTRKNATPRKHNPFQVIEGNKGKTKSAKKDEEKIYH